MKTPPRVLGIDTSLRSTGVGVVEARGTTFSAVMFDVIKNAPSASHSECLRQIRQRLTELMKEHQPTAAAIEGVFHMKNVKTAVTLGQARGVAIEACAQANLPIYEYAPRRIKQAVVGYGNAHKGQVSAMIVKLLGLADPPQEDAADALAIAFCHLNSATGHTVLDAETI